MKADKALEELQDVYKNLLKAQALKVAVGLPKEKTSGIVYSETAKRRGQKPQKEISVTTVGASHEFGVGNNPKRSFLRMPFTHEKKRMEKRISQQFTKVFEGRDSEKALEIVGLEGREIVLDAFASGGFGTWQPLSAETIAAKKSSKILEDTNTLKNSITWVVRR